ncbi:hypothetical protein BBX45_11170 [Proteus mirabilis]|uniref:hypothetical protein n=1 Tax=Proteus mirabilis TaxID=584 RepID=UPI0008DD1307|nr:hypothetical protein [Proteus mirabilis]OHY48221.1 hypothetical protein BBX45_11170 [Proteus mirabilis]
MSIKCDFCDRQRVDETTDRLFFSDGRGLTHVCDKCVVVLMNALEQRKKENSLLNEVDCKIKETESRLNNKQSSFEKDKELGCRITTHRFKI